MKVPCALLVLSLAHWSRADSLVDSVARTAADVAKSLSPVKMDDDGKITVKGPLSAVGEKVIQAEVTANAGLKGTLQALSREVSAMHTPFVADVLTFASSQCDKLKKLLRVDYEKLGAEKEPNLNHLNLVFRTNKVKIVYNLIDAPLLLAASEHFDPNNKLVIFMHGFIDDPLTDRFGTVSDAFLSTGQFNVLGLDSSSLIRWLYLRSTSYIRFIGERLGEVLATLVQEKGLNPESIHLVGHSLGAHIAGFAGKAFRARTGRGVGRVTGLDPAGPCFSHVGDELRLKSTDADFVDAIHTDDGVLGLHDVVGHADFFPNGGSQQPSCPVTPCSHMRAVELFAESITRPQAFPGVQCESWNQFRENKCSQDVSLMGYGCLPSARGEVYLQTADGAPFGLGAGGLRYVNNEGVVRNLATSTENLFK